MPFDSDYRYIAELTENQESHEKVIFIKGSPDKLFEMAQKEDTNFDLAKWQQRVNDWSSAGKRVIAVGYQPVPSNENLTEVEHEHLYRGIKFLGLAALLDAPREEVIAALKKMNTAGVHVKMITGDDPQTARAIGKELGLTNGPINAITGAEWGKLSAKERESRCP